MQAFTLKATHGRVCGLTHRTSVVGLLLALLLAQHEQVQAFHLVAGPRCFSEKFQARTHAGVVREAADRDACAQIGPTVMVGQLGDDVFEGQAMQRVARLRRVWRWWLHAVIVPCLVWVTQHTEGRAAPP